MEERERAAGLFHTDVGGGPGRGRNRPEGLQKGKTSKSNAADELKKIAESSNMQKDEIQAIRQTIQKLEKGLQ